MKQGIVITHKDFFEVLPCSEDDKGVYVVRALTIDKQKSALLPRLLKVDKRGVLYIGSTPKRSLYERIGNFRNCVLPDTNGTAHTAGRKYNEIEALRKKIPYTQLAISIEVSSDPEKMEMDLIEKYRQEFGELPPLNSSK